MLVSNTLSQINRTFLFCFHTANALTSLFFYLHKSLINISYIFILDPGSKSGMTAVGSYLRIFLGIPNSTIILKADPSLDFEVSLTYYNK